MLSPGPLLLWSVLHAVVMAEQYFSLTVHYADEQCELKSRLQMSYLTEELAGVVKSGRSERGGVRSVTTNYKCC